MTVLVNIAGVIVVDEMVMQCLAENGPHGQPQTQAYCGIQPVRVWLDGRL